MQRAQMDSEHTFSLSKQKTKLLIVEDEVLFARAVARRLQKQGYDCEHVETLADARNALKQFAPDMLLLDMRLPDGNGLDLIAECVAKQTAVIVMTAFGEISDAVNAIKLGATDYLKKPIDLEELLLTIQKTEQALQQHHQLDYSRQRNVHAIEGVAMLGESAAINSVRQQIMRIAQLVASDTAPPTVLIEGETGTGKDIAARLLHLSCAHHDKPFVQVDCASLPADLMESELFGHEKGAFTGAQTTKPGLIEAAEDGTLFLDEIGELPLSLQAKLLNVLERRMVRRLGATKERQVAARFIAATHRDLHQMVLQGTFRQDLYYRLNVMQIRIPPLRERTGDAVLLAQHFAQQTAKRYSLTSPIFTPETVQRIQHYAWPGNVRELRHQISRAVLLCGAGLVRPQDLSLPQTAAQATPPINPVGNVSPIPNIPNVLTLDVVEKTLLENALADCKNNVSKAARQLGITRMTMRYRMEKHSLSV